MLQGSGQSELVLTARKFCLCKLPSRHIHCVIRTDTHIFVSTLRGSFLFKLDGCDAATHIDSSSAGFVLDEPTLAMRNVRKRVIVDGRSTYGDSPWIVQVTAHAMTLVEYDPVSQMFSRVSTWTVEGTERWKGREIVAASVNPSQFIIALSRGVIALFNLEYTGVFNLVQYVP